MNQVCLQGPGLEARVPHQQLLNLLLLPNMSQKTGILMILVMIESFQL